MTLKQRVKKVKKFKVGETVLVEAVIDDTYAGNSDAIMIISVNPKFKSLKLISIPRDTAAYIDGEKNRYKINAKQKTVFLNALVEKII